MSSSKRYLRTTILAGVSTLAIVGFAPHAQAQQRLVTCSSASCTASMTPGGGTNGSATYTGAGPLVIGANTILTNNGVNDTHNNAEIVLLDDTDAGWNRLTLQDGSSLTLSGGNNSTVYHPSAQLTLPFSITASSVITVGSGASINKTGGEGNAIYGDLSVGPKSMQVINNGTILASNGATNAGNNGAISLYGVTIGESFTYSGTGNVTATGGTSANNDAIRITNSVGGTINMTFDGSTGGGNVSSTGGGSAIDLSGVNAHQTNITFHNGGRSSAGGILLGAGGGGDGTVNVNFTGNGNSTITGTIAGINSANTTLTVNKTAGTANITGAITEVDSVIVTAGTLDLDGAGSNVGRVSVASGATLDISGINGALTVGDAGTPGVVTDDFVVSGALQTAATAVINGNMALVAGSTVTGDLTFGGGDTSLRFTGNGDDSYSANMNGGAGTDELIVQRSNAANTVTLSGAISGFEAVGMITGNLTLTGAVTGVTTFLVQGGQTLTFGAHASDVAFTTIALAADNTAVVFDRVGQTFTGNITDTAGGTLTQSVTLTNGTVLGNVGFQNGDDVLTVSAGRLGTLNTHSVNMGDGADTINLNGGTIASVIAMGAGDDIFNFAGGTLTGALNMGAGTDTFNVTATGLSTGNTINSVDVFNVGAGHLFTANHAINGTTNGTGNLNLGAGSTFHAAAANARFGGNVNFTNTASTLHINTGRTVTATGVSGTAGTVAVGFNNTDAGKLVLSSLADMSNYTLQPIADIGMDFTGSKAFVIVDGLAGNATKFGRMIDVNTLFTFTQTEDDVAGNIILNVARQNQMSQITTDPNTKSAAPSVEQLLTINTNTPQADRNPVTVDFAARLTTSTDAEINEILKTVIPTVDQGGVMAAMNVKHKAYSQINARVENLRAGRTTGVSSGDAAAQGGNVWIQAFGNTADQDRRQGIEGYDADTYGLSVGADAQVTDNALVGLAFSYANTDIDSKNANRTKTDVDSYQLTAYGSHEFGQGTYVNGYASYSYNDIDQKRHNVGIIGNTASADYHSDQYDARVELGHDYNNVLDTQGLTFTPELSLQYTSVDAARYSEKGAGGLGLQNVRSDTLQALEMGVNTTLAYDHQIQNGDVVTPSVKVGYAYEALGESLQTTGSFAGGGAAFKTEGFDPAQHSVTGGVGLTYSATSNWDISANYDYTFKSDYDAHSGIVKAKMSF